MDRGDANIISIEELITKVTAVKKNMATISKENVELYVFKFGEKIKAMLYGLNDQADLVRNKMSLLEDKYIKERKDYFLVQDVVYFQNNKVKFDRLLADLKILIEDQFVVLLNLEKMRINITTVDALNKKIDLLEQKNSVLNEKIENIVAVFKSIAERTTNLEISFEEFGANVKKIIDDIYDSTVTHSDLEAVKSKIISIDSKTEMIPRMIIK